MEELKRIRKERGLTQRELANRAGLVHSTVALIETGRHTPRMETLEKLAAALEIEPADLLPKAQPPLDLDEEDETLVRVLMHRVKADELSVFDALDEMRAAGILQPRAGGPVRSRGKEEEAR